MAKRKLGSAPAEQRAEIAFGGVGEGPSSLLIWHGLSGVCRELDEIQGSIDSETVSRYGRLASAASVLAGLLDERLMLWPEGWLKADEARAADQGVQS